MKNTVEKPIIEWSLIPAGTFLMGSKYEDAYRREDEIPHEVTLKAFRMAKFAITYEQFDAFCKVAHFNPPADNRWGRGNQPVTNISWHDAEAFAKWMDCRLPTEAEWEYACRAGSTTQFNTGDCLGSDLANYNGNFPFGTCSQGAFRGKTTTVGSFPPNDWGLFDMHGNVWECCSDWYAPYPDKPAINPKGPSHGKNRVIRGGGWRSREVLCRSAFRYDFDPDFRYDIIGFRLAKDL